MSRYNENGSDQGFGFGLKVSVPRPLDPRCIVDNVEDLYGFDDVVYEGMMVVVKNDNNTIYICKSIANRKSKDGWVKYNSSNDLLDDNNMIDIKYLPSYVDDVLEGYYVSETRDWKKLSYDRGYFLANRTVKEIAGYRLDTEDETVNRRSFSLWISTIDSEVSEPNVYTETFATDTDEYINFYRISDKDSKILTLYRTVTAVTDIITTDTFYKTKTEVDDVAEYKEPYTPLVGKIYIDLTTDIQYRWGGSIYVQITEMDALTDAEIDELCDADWSDVE